MPRQQPPRPVRQAQVEKAFHHDLAGKRRRHRRVEARGEQRHREQRRGDAEAEQRRQQLVGLADLGDVGMAAVVEGRGCHDQDRGIDEQRQHQRDGRVRRRPFDRLAPARVVALIGARLHDRGVQIEIMRHHGRADDADRDVEHLRIGDDLGRRHEAAQDCRRPAAPRPRSGPRSRPRSRSSSAMTKASRKRKPRFIRSSSRNASSAAISAPPIRGMPNSSLSAIAVPITSARSQAMIAASQASQQQEVDRPANRWRGRPARGRGR